MMTSNSELLDLSEFNTWLGDCQILKWAHECEFGLFMSGGELLEMRLLDKKWNRSFFLSAVRVSIFNLT
jgi:hypothetical protein